jgi:2-dehydro-3-deoxyphosphogluconate aldolase / (4S)-4-hydroxy-2-oxoglutarate aldolase
LPGLDALIAGLRRQPLLAVLRPQHPEQARRQLNALLAAGLRHVELAISASEPWVVMVQQLIQEFPALALGAASVRTPADLEACVAAGIGYAVSPILDRALLIRAAEVRLPLVPGVFTPTEVHQAVQWGAAVVKLFPAQAVGPRYWQSLSGPLGPMPCCIAAGGLGVDDVEPWLRAGVDAVALGSRLFTTADDPGGLDPGLGALLRRLG